MLLFPEDAWTLEAEAEDVVSHGLPVSMATAEATAEAEVAVPDDEEEEPVVEAVPGQA